MILVIYMPSNQKEYTSKYYLKKEFEVILNKIYIIKQNFELFKVLKSDETKKNITDNMPYTCQIILNSLFNTIILELSKIIVDNSDYKGMENVCVKNFLKKYENNKSLFKEKKYYYVTEINNNKRHRINLDNMASSKIISEYMKLEKENKNLIAYLNKKRNKTIAHNDKQYSFNRKIKYTKNVVTYEQLDNFIDSIYEIVNNLNKSIFGITTINTYYFRDELLWLNELIKNNDKKA